MKVLVGVASKYGSTAEIADVVAEVLVSAGHEATVVQLADENDPDPTGYDAVVLGSAVYMGRWLKPARQFVESQRVALRARPVWVFSSGPIGDPPKPDPDALDLTEVVDAVAPRGEAVFSGRLDRGRLHIGDRAVVAALRAPDGDFREWDAIRAWATSIHTDLEATAAA